MLLIEVGTKRQKTPGQAHYAQRHQFFEHSGLCQYAL